MKYHSVYVMGGGSTPFYCAQLLHQLGVECVFWEIAQQGVSFVKNNIISLGIEYREFDKNRLEDALSKQHNILILSVNNTFIFPSSMVQRKNVDIINYHNSLLPCHKGMHAEAWAIYSNEVETGVTWHFVDEGVDSGDIILQKKIMITENTTSLTLLKEQSRVAISALSDCIGDILLGEILCYPQSKTTQQCNMHLKRDVPNNGELNHNWENDKIWCFLRAMDYGSLNTLGQPTVYYNGKKYGWMSYRRFIADSKTLQDYENEKNIIINNSFVLKNVFEISDKL